MTPTLETARLRLGPWRLAHHQTLTQIFADADAVRFVGGGMDVAGAWNFLLARIGSWSALGHGHFAVEEKSTGLLVGWSGVIKPFDWPEHELGYGLARSFWGLGYATEACRAVLAWARDEKRWPTLVSYIHPDNAPSIRVADRLGARRDGIHDLRGKSVLVFRHHPPLAAA